jgi:hypothetical protein
MVDWGYIWKVNTNNLADEVIDGFLFNYVTNDLSTDGITLGLLFWDQATGWGDSTMVQEFGLAFSGFANMAPFPTWYAVSWTYTFDLSGGNQLFEFLMDKGDINTAPKDGVMFGLWNGSTEYVSPNPAVPPAMGFVLAKPDGPKSDANFAQSDDVVATYDANFNLIGHWFFGGYTSQGIPAANMSWELYAAPIALNTKYQGPLQGNELMLYVTGNWATGGNAHFMLRQNEMTPVNKLVACLNTKSQKYYGGAIDTTIIFPVPIPWIQNMIPIDNPTIGLIGDYSIYDWTNMKATVATKTTYWQGLITDKFNGGSTTPIDASWNYVRAN